MTLPLLLATLLLGRDAEVRPATQKWADWLRTHTGIAAMSGWTRTTWKDDPKSVTDPGFLSPTGDRLLTLDGRIVPYTSFTPRPGTFFLMGPDPLRPDGEATVAILLAQGRWEEALALAGTVRPEEARAEISRAVQMHAMRRYSQAAWRFERREDRGALLAARDLLRDLPSLKAIVQETIAGYMGDWRPLQSLDAVPRLVADLERRERKPNASGAFNPKTASVEALIERLEESDGGIRFSRGRPSYANTAVVQELGARGNAAVPALLNVLDSDDRLTRDVYGRDHSDEVFISRVTRPAAEALELIAGTRNVPGAHGRGDLEADAAAYRRFFDVTRGQTLGQRAIVLLRESPVSTVWHEAARNLVRPTVTASDVPDRDARNVIREGTRLSPAERAEAVTLLERRLAEELAQPVRSGSWVLAEIIGGHAVARALLQPEGAGPILKKATDAAERAFAQEEGRVGGGREIARAFRLRIRRKDPGAVEEYGTWLRRLGARSGGSSPELGALAPLTDLDEDSGLVPIARWVFESTDSPYAQDLYEILAHWNGPGYDRLGPCPRFVREALLRRLMDTTIVGTATRAVNGAVELRFVGHEETTVWESEPGELRVGDTQPIRRSDVFAWHLAGFNQGYGTYSLGWSPARRNAALKRIRKSLAEQG